MMQTYRTNALVKKYVCDERDHALVIDHALK